MTDIDTRRVLAGAKARLQHRYVDLDAQTCECSTRAENDVPITTPYLAPDQGAWCFLCAVEAEQMNLGLDGDFFGLALNEVAHALSGQRFSLTNWRQRDEVLMAHLDGAGQAKTLAAFDKAIDALAWEQSA